MAQEMEKTEEDLEQLRQRLQEFRRVRTTRGALPEQLWQEAAQAARRHGVNVTAKVLGLAYSGLKMRMEGTRYTIRSERRKLLRHQHSSSLSGLPSGRLTVAR
jgi:hypothetical protein